jgi:hypothetical protein
MTLDTFFLPFADFLAFLPFLAADRSEALSSALFAFLAFVLFFAFLPFLAAERSDAVSSALFAFLAFALLFFAFLPFLAADRSEAVSSALFAFLAFALLFFAFLPFFAADRSVALSSAFFLDFLAEAFAFLPFALAAYRSVADVPASKAGAATTGATVVAPRKPSAAMIATSLRINMILRVFISCWQEIGCRAPAKCCALLRSRLPYRRHAYMTGAAHTMATKPKCVEKSVAERTFSFTLMGIQVTKSPFMQQANRATRRRGFTARFRRARRCDHPMR